MDVPIELTITAENADGRRSGTLYEVLRQERIQNDEYMTIGTAIEGNRRKQPSDQQHTDKKPDTIEETLAEQAKYLNRLKLISVILTITVVVVCVTFGVLIHGLVSSQLDAVCTNLTKLQGIKKHKHTHTKICALGKRFSAVLI